MSSFAIHFHFESLPFDFAHPGWDVTLFEGAPNPAVESLINAMSFKGSILNILRGMMSQICLSSY